MNQKEWWYLCDNHKELLDFTHYKNTRIIQKSLQYNSDKNAKVIHHLRDTEEQRKYNDEHYELWGHNLDGTFEYGKYVIFVTKEWHTNYHAQSEETRKKMSNAQKERYKTYITTEETREKLRVSKLGKNNPMYGMCGELCPNYGRRGELNHRYGTHLSEETRKKISDAQKGEKHWNYGGHISEEAKKKNSEFHTGRKRPKETGMRISESLKEYYDSNPCLDERNKKISDSLLKYFSENAVSDETRKKLSERSKCRKHTNESKKRISIARSEYLAPIRTAYKEYKDNNGSMSWNEFCKEYSKVHNK